VIHQKRTWWRADEADDWDPVLLSEDALGELRWSPDGTKIVFRKGVDIWTMDSDRSSWAKVIEGSRRVMMRDPCWSPNGTHLLCMRQTSKTRAPRTSLGSSRVT
ncbi:MAG: TolB family protein, partial [Planctomycetota bacterium]